MSDEDNFKFFFRRDAMIADYGQFEVPKMETADGVICDAVTPALEYHRNRNEAEADKTYEKWRNVDPGIERALHLGSNPRNGATGTFSR